MKANLKKDPPRKEYIKKKEKGKEIKLDINIGAIIWIITIHAPLKQIANFLEQQQWMKKSLGI